MKFPVLITTVLLTIVTVLGMAQQRPDDRDKKFEMLFVQNAKDVSLVNGKLTLKGIGPTTLFFGDTPKRIAGHFVTDEMIPLWAEAKGDFTKDPVNATLSSFTSDERVVNVVLEVKNPRLADGTMTYDVRVLEGTIPDNVTACSLFINIIGMPFTPFSYAHFARSTARRAIVF